ncbi:MAG TPA: heme exporter protein CcmB [Solirubrobacterales bacterium]|nr:heme exporter protein CcmB [Solirubrobacterales bacterium]
MRPVGAILRKDLLVELRTKESVPSMAIFAVTTFVIFHFGLDRDRLEGELAAGVLWVTILFAAILGINRIFVAEREQGGFDGILMAPIERTSLLIAKAGALFTYLLALELVALPVFALFFLSDGFWEALPRLLVVAVLADLGLATVGALLASIAVHTRARDLLLPLLLLPLTLPVMIGAAAATKPLLSIPLETSGVGKWLAVLALYDLIFGLLAYAVFDFLMED